MPNYVIKKGPSRGARHGPTMMQRIYHIVHNSLRKAKKQDYKSILDRFLNSPRYRESQIATGWDEALCARYDEIALKDHSYVATKAERSRHENSWKMVFNSSGPNGPMDQRDDCEEAQRTRERLHKEQGNCNAKIQTQRSTSTTALKTYPSMQSSTELSFYCVHQALDTQGIKSKNGSYLSTGKFSAKMSTRWLVRVFKCGTQV